MYLLPSVLFHLPVEESSPSLTPSQEADPNLISYEGKCTSILPSIPPLPHLLPSPLFLSPLPLPGLSVVSELIREELGSTDSTADLLRPVPRPRLPFLSHFSSQNSSSLTPPQPSPTPSLTITSLTSNSVTSEQPGTVVLEREGERPRPPHHGDRERELAHSPPSSPPSTPPLSHRRLLSSPLHHSTPHTSTKSRVFPDHTQTVPPSLTSQPLPRPLSFPLTTQLTPSFPLTSRPTPLSEAQAAPTHPTRDLGNPLSAHLLSSAPPATERRESQQEGGGGGETDVASRFVQATVATQTDEVVSGSQTCPQSTPSTASSSMPLVEQSPPVSSPDQETRTQDILEPGHEHSSNSSQSSPSSPTPKFPPGGPRVHFSSPTTQHRSSLEATPSLERSLEVGRRAAEVRAELLASLYQHYLRELRSSQPSEGKGKGRAAVGRTHSTATRNKPRDKVGLCVCVYRTCTSHSVLSSSLLPPPSLSLPLSLLSPPFSFHSSLPPSLTPSSLSQHSLPRRRGVSRRAKPHTQQPHLPHSREEKDEEEEEEEEEEGDGQDKEREEEKRQTLPAKSASLEFVM